MAEQIKALLDFWCPDCKHMFSSEPSPASDAAEAGGADKAPCPLCGTEIPLVPWFMKNLQKARANQTGPTTPEGKAKCAANGYRTGSHYVTHSPGIPHAPCKPFPRGIRIRDISLEGSTYVMPDDDKTGEPREDTGGQYQECVACSEFDLQRERVIESDGTNVRISCHRREEVALLFQQAFEANDPKMLDKLAASANAQARLLFNRLLEDAFRYGAYVDSLVISEGRIVKDEKGNHLHEKKRNTAIDQLCMLAEKFGWTLPDWVMTPKVKEAKEKAVGNLDDSDPGDRTTVREAMHTVKSMADTLKEAIVRGNKAVDEDETVKAFKREAAEHEEP